MDQRKLNTGPQLIYGMICCAVALLLCWTATISVGVAYGRYCKTITGAMTFTPESKQQVWIMGQRDVNQVGTELPTDWKQVGTTTFVRSVSLCVSNSDSSAATIQTEDIAVRIRLYFPESVSGNMPITLQIEGDATEYTVNEGEYLSPSSALGIQKNAGGWIYTFHEATGEELVYVLEGGKVSDINLTLTASNVSGIINDYQLLVDIIHRDGYVQTTA